jgi:hypothetical protein
MVASQANQTRASRLSSTPVRVSRPEPGGVPLRTCISTLYASVTNHSERKQASQVHVAAKLEFLVQRRNLGAQVLLLRFFPSFGPLSGVRPPLVRGQVLDPRLGPQEQLTNHSLHGVFPGQQPFNSSSGSAGKPNKYLCADFCCFPAHIATSVTKVKSNWKDPISRRPPPAHPSDWSIRVPSRAKPAVRQRLENCSTRGR